MLNGTRAWVLGLVVAVAGGVGGVAAAVPTFKLLFIADQQILWEHGGDQPLELTYAFAQGTVVFPTARNCRTLTPIESVATQSNLDPDEVRREIVEGMQLWERATHIRFVEATDWRRADILIGGTSVSRGSAFADVLPRTSSGTRAYLEQSLICFNPDQAWKIGFDGDLKAFDIRYVAAHETGHAIGLDHPSSSGQVMSYRYGEQFRTLRAGDIQGAALLYGPWRPRTPALP